MDCTMCGVVDCSGKQQYIFIPGEITRLHFYCEEHRLSFCASTKITPPPCFWGNDEFLSENCSATLEICHACCFFHTQKSSWQRETWMLDR